MLGYQGLYEEHLKTDITRAPVWTEDDLPDEIWGTAIWFFSEKSKNGHGLPPSYHVTYEATLYPVKFINERWYWIDWDDGDKHTRYWTQPDRQLPQGAYGLGWIGRIPEVVTPKPGGSFTEARACAESSSTQNQGEPAGQPEDDDFIDTNPAQTEELAKEFDNQPIFGDIAKEIDPPQDRTHYLPTTLASGVRLNPIPINPGPPPICVCSTTTRGPTTAAPATLTADAAKVIANSLKVDGQLKGQVPDTFDGDYTKTRNFMNAFDLFWMTNEDSSMMKTAYRWSTFFLELL